MISKEVDYSTQMSSAADRMGAFYKKCLDEFQREGFTNVLEIGCSGGG
jgi:hypothetical protein